MTAISKVLTGMIEGRMVGYHLAAILAGYLLDLCLGDPHSMPHPVRAIGNLIVWLEKYLRPAGKKHATERGETPRGRSFCVSGAACDRQCGRRNPLDFPSGRHLDSDSSRGGHDLLSAGGALPAG